MPSPELFLPVPMTRVALVAPRERLRDALVEARWDTRRAAHELGIHRATLYRRMKRLQLVVPSLRGAP
jgi:transcriptional regulator of acetoin/glycerol metabolism